MKQKWIYAWMTVVLLLAACGRVTTQADLTLAAATAPVRDTQTTAPVTMVPAPQPGASETTEPAGSAEGQQTRLVSPDGEKTAIFSNQSSRLEIELASAFKQDLTLSDGEPDAQFITMAKWAPDSLHLAVAVANTSQAALDDFLKAPPQIWMIQLTENDESPSVTSYTAAGDLATGFITLGTWSPNSLHLTFWPGMRSASILADGLPLWDLDVLTTQARPVADLALANPDYQSWAPDGTALAFSAGGYRSAQVGKWLALYEVASGETQTLVPQEVLVSGQVSWSPDGRQIAFAAVPGAQTGADYSDYLGWDNPAIQGRQIYLYDLDTHEYHGLHPVDTYQDAPHWSPDGRTLYYVQQTGDQAALYESNPTSGDALPLDGCQADLPQAAGYYGQVDWSDLYEACPQIESGLGSANSH